MEDTFSVRIVTADYSLETPLRSVDPVHSECRDYCVKRVPIVRVFGTTPAGQKACVHLHGLFPYLYIKYSDGAHPSKRYLENLACRIDRAVQLCMGQSSRKWQHVFKISPVSGIPYYGYHKGECVFLKIRLYNPAHVQRVAELLRGGRIMDTVFEPYEAHVPFLTQVFMDFNLYGMSFLNLSAVKFRLPLPVGSEDEQSLSWSASFCSSQSQHNKPTRARWTMTNVKPEQLMEETVDRKSKCELELDAVAADILNLFELSSGTVRNPGIAAIWKDEVRRCNALDLPRPKRQSSPERPELTEVLREQRLKGDLRKTIEKRVPSSPVKTTDNDIRDADTAGSCSKGNETVRLVSAREEHRTQEAYQDVRGQLVVSDECTTDTLQAECDDVMPALESSQNMLLNSGSFSVQLLTDLSLTGAMSSLSQPLASSQHKASQVPSLTSSQDHGGASHQASTMSSQSLGLSSFDLQQLLDDASLFSQRSTVIAHMSSQPVAPASPGDEPASQNVQSPSGCSQQVSPTQDVITLERLLQLQSNRDELLADSDDDELLRELAKRDEEESVLLAQECWDDFHDNMKPLQRSPKHDLNLGEMNETPVSPHTPMLAGDAHDSQEVSFLLPCDASTPVTHSTPEGYLDRKAPHQSRTPRRREAGPNLFGDSSPLLDFGIQGQSENSTLELDSLAFSCDTVLSQPCPGETNSDTMQYSLLSSKVEKNLRCAAKRVRKRKGRRQSDFFDKASVFYLTGKRFHHDTATIARSARSSINALDALAFPDRDEVVVQAASLADVVKRLDAFAVMAGASTACSRRRTQNATSSSMVECTSSEHVELPGIMASSSSQLASGSSTLVCDAARSESPDCGAILISDDSSAEDGGEQGGESSEEAEATLQLHDINRWQNVTLGDATFRVPDFEPPSRNDVAQSAPTHGLPSCVKVDARFSNPADYRGPKNVGFNRICVPALTTVGAEEFSTQNLSDTRRSRSGLTVWRGRVNESNMPYWPIAAKIDISSVSLLNADSVRRCAELRAGAVSRRACWLTPSRHPPTRASVALWSSKQKRSKKPRKLSAGGPAAKGRSAAGVVKPETHHGNTILPPAVHTAPPPPVSDVQPWDEKKETKGDSVFASPSLRPVANTMGVKSVNVTAADAASPAVPSYSGSTLVCSRQTSTSSTGHDDSSGSELTSSFLVPTQILPTGGAEGTRHDERCQQHFSYQSATSSDSDFPAGQRRVMGDVSSSCVASPPLLLSSSGEMSGQDLCRVTHSGCNTSNCNHSSCTGSLQVSSSGTCSEQAATNSGNQQPGSERLDRQASSGSEGFDDSMLVAMLDATQCSSVVQEPVTPLDGTRTRSQADGFNDGGMSRESDTNSSTPTTAVSQSPTLSSLPFSSDTSRNGSMDQAIPSSVALPSYKPALRSVASQGMTRRTSSSVSFSVDEATSSSHTPPTLMSSSDKDILDGNDKPRLQLFKRRGSESSLRTPPAKRRRSSLLKSQLDGPSFTNEHGFHGSILDLGEAHSVHESQFLTLLTVEVHTDARGSLIPDPDVDAVSAIFYTIVWELGGDRSLTENGVFMVSSSSVPFAAYAVSADRHEFVADESKLFDALVKLVETHDPEVLLGYEIQKRSWGYLLHRATKIDIPLVDLLSRLQPQEPEDELKLEQEEGEPEENKPRLSELVSFDVEKEVEKFHKELQKEKEREKGKGKQRQYRRDPEHPANAYSERKMSEILIPGRIILNAWRMMRHEAALSSYTLPSVAFHILHVRLPDFSFAQLARWFDDSSVSGRSRVLEFYLHRCHYTMQILRRLDLIARTSELARLFGLQFFEVLTRGSQFRVESMMLRLTRQENLVALSPGVQERARMNAPECIPLILEPESRFYTDPVIVVDFQSLYPSMMIAYNYCFSTCLGRLAQFAEGEDYIKFGCSVLKVDAAQLKELENDITISPNGVVFVKKHVRHGILPRMLDEILTTRIMVKQAMKQCKSNKSVHRMLDHRQLGLKMIANVTYGYTSANFSGRMPCVEVADSVVRKGRETLERAIQLVKDTKKWGARVVYGDTDSMFIQVRGVTKERAFEIGKEIVDTVTQANPKPVKLKFEKVYYPCLLETKKRYCGMKYESLDQKEPEFEAKGIETVRRDGCPAVVKVLGRCLKMLFNTKDVSQCKAFVQRQCVKILQGKVNLQDLIMAREYRGMATYKPTASVPCLQLTKRLLEIDKRSEPLVAERVPYIVTCGTPGQPLIYLVRRPIDVLEDNSVQINTNYYIKKQLLPPLNRVFHLLGVDVFTWFDEVEHVVKVNPMFQAAASTAKGNLADFFSSLHCPVCQTITRRGVCTNCRDDRQRTVAILSQRLNQQEKNLSNLEDVCRSCCRRQHVASACQSIECPVFFRRHQSMAALKAAVPLREKFLLAPYATQDVADAAAAPVDGDDSAYSAMDQVNANASGELPQTMDCSSGLDSSAIFIRADDENSEGE